MRTTSPNHLGRLPIELPVSWHRDIPPASIVQVEALEAYRESVGKVMEVCASKDHVRFAHELCGHERQHVGAEQQEWYKHPSGVMVELKDSVQLYRVLGSELMSALKLRPAHVFQPCKLGAGGLSGLAQLLTCKVLSLSCIGVCHN